MIEVVYRDDDLLAFYKPGGLPTVPLKGQKEDTLLSLAGENWPEILSPWGKNPWEGSIIHRLDTPTSGLVLAARNKATYDALLSLQAQDKITKTYRATISSPSSVLPGFEAFPYSYDKSGKMEIVSSFRSYGPKGASVRPLLGKRKGDERLYSTTVIKKDEREVECTISRGFRHQIRCHLAWSGTPILGDDRYGGEDSPVLYLEAIKMSFPRHGGKDTHTISIN